MPFIGPLKGGRMPHAFCRTTQGRLPKPMSSKGKTTFSFLITSKNKKRCDILFLKVTKKWGAALSFYEPKKSGYGFLVK